MTLSGFDLGVLGEIGNVSFGGAAAALSDFVNKKVVISIPQIETLTFKEVKNAFSPSVVFSKIDYTEGLSGSNIMLMKKEEAVRFSQILVKEKLGIETRGWDELAQNALSEMYNIMVGKMSSSMSELFQRSIKIAPPQIFETTLERLSFFEEGEGVAAVWIDLRLEAEIEFKMLNLFKTQEAAELVELVKSLYL